MKEGPEKKRLLTFVFKQIDLNNDGAITKEELHQFGKKLKGTVKEQRTKEYSD